MPQAPQHALLTTDVLADQLRKLADDSRIAPRADELRTLAQDLERRTHLDQWAEVDLVRSFVRRESLAPAPSGGQPARLTALIGYLRTTGPTNRSLTSFARWLRDGLRQRPVRDGALEAVMGVLVFIPLLVTWIGLREAVAAYGELSKDDSKEATRPFLQLWQSGFGGHLSAVGRFENVALTTVAFIVLLVLLGIWHARARARTEREEAQGRGADEHLLGGLASLLTQAQLLLVPHRGASPQQFARELTNAAKQLGALAAKAEHSHQALTATGTLIKQATDDLQAAARGLTAEIPKLGGVAGRLETAMRDGQEVIVRAGKDNTTAAQGIADRIEAAGATVQSALGTLAAAQQTLAEKSEVVAQANDRASQALLASTARTNDAIDGMREATERWDAAAAHWQDAAARLDSGIQALSGERGAGAAGDWETPPGRHGTPPGAWGMPSHAPEAPSAGQGTAPGGQGMPAGDWQAPTSGASVAAPGPGAWPGEVPVPVPGTGTEAGTADGPWHTPPVSDASPAGNGASGYPSPPPPGHAPAYPEPGAEGRHP